MSSELQWVQTHFFSYYQNFFKLSVCNSMVWFKLSSVAYSQKRKKWPHIFVLFSKRFQGKDVLGCFGSTPVFSRSQAIFFSLLHCSWDVIPVPGLPWDQAEARLQRPHSSAAPSPALYGFLHSLSPESTLSKPRASESLLQGTQSKMCTSSFSTQTPCSHYQQMSWYTRWNLVNISPGHNTNK